MSGIFGIVDPGRGQGIEPRSHAMAAVMSHHVSFVSDLWVQADHGVALGRLGIGIFNRAVQPVWNADRSVALFFVGELYAIDGHERRGQTQCDEIAALELYEARGTQFVAHLNGMFVLAVWDARRKLVVVANDRYGLYPLYYSYTSGRFVFAPEVKAILCDPGVDRALNLTALAEYVRFQHLLGDKTFFEGVQLLPNACMLVYDLNERRLTSRQYWEYSDLPSLPHGVRFEEAVEEAGRLLRQSVRRRLDGEYRVGIYLSGGVDSRVILGMAGLEHALLPTVTFGMRGSRDVVYAAAIARAARTQHHWFEFRDGRWVEEFANLHFELTEGFHSWIHAHGISILDQARVVMEVNLAGLHGQELNWEDPSLAYAPDEAAFVSRLFYELTQETTWPSIDEAEEAALFCPQMATELRGLAFQSLREEVARVSHLPTAQRAIALSCDTDRRFFQYYTVFNRSRIEQRFPFYDYEYFDFIHALPMEMTADRRLRRVMIYRNLPRLARIPCEKDELPITGTTTGFLAARTAHRAKGAFNRHVRRVFPETSPLHSNYEGWLRNELRAWGEELLLSSRSASRGFFQPRAVESLWRRHLSGREMNIIGKLAPLMTFELIMRRFFDASDPAPGATVHA